MGVMATYCQICGAPMNQDHYVELENLLGIWRGGDGHEVCDPAFAFGKEHAWLKDALALRLDERQNVAVLEGQVHDGGIEDAEGEGYDEGFLCEGLEERAALHRACWQLAGRPQAWKDVALRRGEDPFEPFKQQLFEFTAFADAGHGWMLVDPGSTSPEGVRNRERIAALILK